MQAPSINRYQSIITPTPAINRVQEQQQKLVDNSGKAMTAMGEVVGQYGESQQKLELTREKANQELWMASREAQDKVAAKQIYETAVKSAKSGGSIKEGIDKEWAAYTQKQQEATKDNPYLNTAYSEQLAKIKGAVDLQTNEWETTEQSRYTAKTTQDAAENMKRNWEELPDAASVNKQFQDDVMRLNKIVDSAQLDPAEKDKLRDILKKDMPDGAMSIIIDKNPDAVAAFGGGNFNYAVSQVLGKEGGYVANDAGNGETNFGINKTANPDVDVKNLTKEKATELYRERYWNAIGADKLPPDLAYIAFDAAVNQGVPAAKEMLQKANGDVQKFVQLREERYKETAKNPEKAAYLDTWLKRNQDTLQESSGISAYKMGTLEQRMGWKEKAERKIVAREAESKRQISLGESYIKTIEDRMEQGLEVPATEYQAVQQQIATINNPTLNQKWAETTAKADAQKEYLRMTPMELQGYINTTLQPMATQDGATRMEAAKLDIAQKTLTSMTEMVQSNPLGQMQKAGIVVPGLDFQQPTTLLNRMSAAQQASGAYAIPLSQSFFQPSEKAFVDGYLSKEAPDKQLALAQSFTMGMGTQAGEIASVFDKTAPEFAYAVGMLSAAPNRTDIAKEILSGAYAMKNDPSLAPSQSEVDSSLTDWEGYFGSPTQFSAAKKAGMAIYVARNGGRSFDSDILEQSMQDAIGGERARVNGVNTITPAGVNKDQFESWAQTLTKERIVELFNNSHPYYKDNKGMPKAQFDPKEDKVRLRSIGSGYYQMMGANGKPLAGNGIDGAAVIRITARDVAQDAQMVKKAEPLKTSYRFGG